MTPGQSGTIGSCDSILEAAKLSCRLFLPLLFCQLTLLINHALYMRIHQLQSCVKLTSTDHWHTKSMRQYLFVLCIAAASSNECNLEGYVDNILHNHTPRCS